MLWAAIFVHARRLHSVCLPLTPAMMHSSLDLFNETHFLHHDAKTVQDLVEPPLLLGAMEISLKWKHLETPSQIGAFGR